MSDYDYIDNQISWIKEDIGELQFDVDRLKNHSHPPVTFAECPQCHAICFDIEEEDGLTGYDRHMSWHLKNTLEDCIDWVGTTNDPPNLKHCKTCRCGHATMDPLAYGV